MSEFRPTPETINQKSIENMRIAGELSRNVSRILTTDNASFTDGVLFDANGDEADDPVTATAVGSVGFRVATFAGVPVALRVADYRVEPGGLYRPPATIKTQIVFTAAANCSIDQPHHLQVTAVEQRNYLGHKQPLSAFVHYLLKNGDGFTRKPVEPDKEARFLGRALAITHKLA